MRDFPSCSGENGVQISGFSSSNAGKNAQNLVICIYRCRIRGRTYLITVTWTKNLMGQCVTVGVDDSCNRSLRKVEIKPWLFTKRKGSKNLEAYSCNIDVFWDLSSAKFGSSPEPLGGFYVGVVVDKYMALLLGDMKKEAFKKTNAAPSSTLGVVFIAKKEHVFGKRTSATKAQFSGDGKTHDLVIECDTSLSDPCLPHCSCRWKDLDAGEAASLEVPWQRYDNCQQDFCGSSTIGSSGCHHHQEMPYLCSGLVNLLKKPGLSRKSRRARSLKVMGFH